MPSSANKVKCPGCGRQVLKKVIAATKGRCNSCGYAIAGSMEGFFPKPKTTIEMLSEISA